MPYFERRSHFIRKKITFKWFLDLWISKFWLTFALNCQSHLLEENLYIRTNFYPFSITVIGIISMKVCCIPVKPGILFPITLFYVSKSTNCLHYFTFLKSFLCLKKN